jgi:hypothetical protein
MLTHDVQAWEQLLHVASGKLELGKCCFGLIRWTYDSSGNATVCPTTEEELQITDSETGQAVNVPQLDAALAYKYLGVQIAFDGNMETQKQALREKCQQFQNIFAQSHLSQSIMQHCYQTVFSPAIRYVFPATSLDSSFLDNVQCPIICLVLAKMGFNHHMPQEVALAPLHFGGLGLLDLVVEQGIAQVLFVLGHIRSTSDPSHTILILLETYQLSAGSDDNPLEATVSCDYIDSPWVHSIQGFLRQCNAKILIPLITSLEPLRESDRTIMSYAMEQSWTLTERRKINNCRLFFQVMYVSEITNTHGTHILDCALYGHTTQEGRSSLTEISRTSASWPSQPRPDGNAWGTWKKFISTMTTSSLYNRLRQPLG